MQSQSLIIPLKSRIILSLECVCVCMHVHINDEISNYYYYARYNSLSLTHSAL